MRLKMDCWGCSAIGRNCPVNDDQFLVADLHKSMRLHQTSLSLESQTRLHGSSMGQLLVVADGHGGDGSKTQRASQQAVDALVSSVLSANRRYFFLTSTDVSLERQLRTAVEDSQERVEQIAETDADFPPSSPASILLAYLFWPRIFLVGAGTCRSYLFRDGGLCHLLAPRSSALSPSTFPTDHVESPGKTPYPIGAEEKSPGDHEATLETTEHQLEPGDILLLCTDGLYRQLSDEEIRSVLRRDTTARQMGERLVERATGKAGGDNVTVIVSRFLTSASEQLAAHAAAEDRSEGGDSSEAGETRIPAPDRTTNKPAIAR
ncbi:MAG: protein phosphatase [Pirellulaceae bacterium]|nr:MAG: protein phosphatase [Pirellulaceae bacterium]